MPPFEATLEPVLIVWTTMSRRPRRAAMLGAARRGGEDRCRGKLNGRSKISRSEHASDIREWVDQVGPLPAGEMRPRRAAGSAVSVDDAGISFA